MRYPSPPSDFERWLPGVASPDSGSQGPQYPTGSCTIGKSMPRASKDLASLFASRPTIISCDIFDTVLLRRAMSEPRRQWMAATRIVRRFPGQTCTIPAVYRARRLSQETAYRSNQIGRSGLDVTIREILSRQAALIGLPPESLEDLVAIEIEVEKQSLVPNRALISKLRRAHLRGSRVIAVSDTPLSITDIKRLLRSLIGETIFDSIYTSAECGGRKHNGRLFRYVRGAEGVNGDEIFHVGDNRHSDGDMAALAGYNAFVLPRSQVYIAARVLDSALFQCSLMVRVKGAFPPKPAPGVSQSPHTQRRMVLGPLVAEYCLRLWLYLSCANQDDRSVALFCARGGIGQRIAFERFLARTGLKLEMRRENLLVSRVIASRGAVLSQSPAASDALAYEFKGSSLRDAAEALAGEPLTLGADWDRPFDAVLFFALLKEDPSARTLNSILLEQNNLFNQHLERLIGSAKRVLLCDTGLYGSTIRLLQAARPDIHFELLLLARSNYRGGDESHFAQTVGLLSEVDHYGLNKRSSIVLRYWHLIESLFELSVPSATTFPCVAELASLSEGFSNSSFAETDHLVGASFKAVSEYLDDLAKQKFLDRIMGDSLGAWQRLKFIVITPKKIDVDLWATGPRGRDFGRAETVEAITMLSGPGLMARIRAIRYSRWKEGAIAKYLGWFRAPVQWALEAVYLGRSAIFLLRGQSTRIVPALAFEKDRTISF
jgi:FMN phosphatase YigB (HAD superfamily)